MSLLVVLLIAAMPLGWIIAEFRGGPAVRRVFGCVTILTAFGWGAVSEVLRDFQNNLYFTRASKELLDTTVQQLQAGKTEAVAKELSRANDKFKPTYENKARYREIVDEAVAGMRK